jgi:hypothetical protein
MPFSCSFLSFTSKADLLGREAIANIERNVTLISRNSNVLKGWF